MGRRATSVPATIARALGDYAAVKRRAGQAERAGEAETVLRRHIPKSLADVPLNALNADILNDWLASLGSHEAAGKRGHGERHRPLAQGRVDKIRGVMKAALRAAGAPTSATRDGLAAAAVPNRTEPAARNVTLLRAEIDRLLVEIDQRDPDLGLFVRACDLTGARPGQLARCRVSDLDVAGGMLTIPRSAKGKPGLRKTRHGIAFPVGIAFAQRIAAQADTRTGLLFHAPRRVQDFSNLAPGAPLGSNIWRVAGRTAWHKGLWVRTMRASVATVGLADEVTLYALRHSRAIALIRGGLSLRETAALLDTSAAMLERTYSRDIAHGAATTSRVRALLSEEAERQTPSAVAVAPIGQTPDATAAEAP
jgi:integrase